ncbi:MAG: DsbA family protein, partial [Bryobacteraceae bacterium]
QLFDNQAAITPDNIHQKLLEFAKGAKSLNVEQFQSCLDNQMSLGLVLRDINLASENKIDATPTLFINGKRAQGAVDANELKRLIDEAQKGQSGVSASHALLSSR